MALMNPRGSRSQRAADGPWSLLLAPMRCAFALVLLLGTGLPALAHRLSDAALRLRATPDHGLVGRLDIPLRDLALVLPLDADRDDAITWGELKASAPQLDALLRRELRWLHQGQPLPWRFETLQVAELAGEPCASIQLSSPLPAEGEVVVLYNLLFQQDPEHRGLLTYEEAGRTSTAVLSPGEPTWRLPRVAPGAPAPAPTSPFRHFIAEGVHHIWIGTDHILFLVALLLPSVVLHRDRHIVGADRLRPVVVEILQTVTAFTVAHSLTLALATLDVIRLPSRLVETVIAASVSVAACNNLVPLFRDRSWCVAFAFGLVHGFGFASVLADLDLPARALAGGLFGFNLGVELGQLAIVAAFLPVAYALRQRWVYHRLVLQGGSVIILIVAAIWAVERGLGIA